MFRFIILSVILFYCTGFQKPDDLVKGKPAPDFVLNTAAGDNISLSSLKGSLVFIDFWASWCLPCRKQNVSLVKLQEKYKLMAKRKGLNVVFVSVSLDTNKELWNVAVVKDNLNWKLQACDFKGWDSPVVKAYQVKKIPTSFLLGKDGIILAKDIWGSALETELDKIYNQLSN